MNIKMDAFEGPLDLLFYLIDQAEVDIYEISVSEITEQYVDYIHKMQELELDVASEYLVMAAHLLAIKSGMLLPKQEDPSFQPLLELEVEEIDPREELIERLVEYKTYKNAAERLREKETVQSKVYTKPAEDLSMFVDELDENPVQEVSLFDLLAAFQKAMHKPDTEPSAKIDREEWSIEDRMMDIHTRLQQESRVSFQELLREKRTKDLIVVTFMAILEMMKNNTIRCVQNSLFDDIWISRAVKGVANEQNGT